LKRCRIVIVYAFIGYIASLGVCASVLTQVVRAAQDLDAAQDIKYRRVFVPADNVDTWPRAGEKLLPIESKEFLALIDKANRAESNKSTSATINEAQYTARMVDNRLINCQGRWAVAAHDERRAFLRLAQMSLALHNAHWQKSPDRPARLGVWGRSGAAPDTMGVEVPRSDTLEFTWWAPAMQIHNGIEIPWRLPRAVVSRLVLDLPQGKEPQIEGGW